MNNNIIQDLLRMRELFGLTEQSSPFSVVEMLKSNDPVKIKEFLTEKSDLQKKLQELFSASSLDDLTNKIINSNKTIVMRGLQRSSMAGDVEMYEFLNSLLSSKN